MEAAPLFSIRAHGKLLISGEYAVLDGAKALACPARYGQTLKVFPTKNPGLHWTSLDHEGNSWFQAEFSISNFSVNATNDEGVATNLQNILSKARALNTAFLTGNESGLIVITSVDFPRNWGLGTSSTLLYAIAKWAKVDPFQLSDQTMGGSGYDIACAGANHSIFYRRTPDGPVIQPSQFDPPFKDHLYFVYLGKKQNSRDAIRHYRQQGATDPDFLSKISLLSEKMALARTLPEFEELVVQHEELLAPVLKMPKVKSLYFEDYWGAVKSLGAWGGDFVLVTSERGIEETRGYFRGRGFGVVLSWGGMMG